MTWITGIDWTLNKFTDYTKLEIISSRCLCHLSERSRQLDTERCLYIWQREMWSPAHWKYPVHQQKLSANQLKSSLLEKDHEELKNKLATNQQCTLVNKGQQAPGLHSEHGQWVKGRWMLFTTQHWWGLVWPPQGKRDMGLEKWF